MLVALLVDDLNLVLEKMAASDWKAAGKPQRLQSGPNAGKRVVYVRDPDGTTIELMQMRRKVHQQISQIRFDNFLVPLFRTALPAIGS